VTVGDGFYVGLDYGAADVVIPGAWSLLLFLLEDGLAVAAAVEWSTAMVRAADGSSKVLPWAHRVAQFWDIVNFADGIYAQPNECFY